MNVYWQTLEKGLFSLCLIFLCNSIFNTIAYVFSQSPREEQVAQLIGVFGRSSWPVRDQLLPFSFSWQPSAQSDLMLYETNSIKSRLQYQKHFINCLSMAQYNTIGGSPLATGNHHQVNLFLIFNWFKSQNVGKEDCYLTISLIIFYFFPSIAYPLLRGKCEMANLTLDSLSNINWVQEEISSLSKLIV